MPKKRKFGTGSIIFIKSRNAWRGKISVGVALDGKIINKYVYAKTKTECEKKLDEICNNMFIGIDMSASAVTLMDIINEKNENDFRNNLISESAYSRRVSTAKIISQHIISRIPLQQISDRIINDFLSSITDYSNSVIKKIYQMTKSAYGIAVFRGILRVNPLDKSSGRNVPKSSKSSKIVTAFSLNEEQQLLKMLMKEFKYEKLKGNYITQFLISLLTGMRMGEINALTFSDIDFNKRIITVNKTVSRGIENEAYISNSTKTKAGTRTLPMSDEIYYVLQYYVNNIYPKISKGIDAANNLLFITFNTHKIITSSQVNDSFRRLCKKHNIKDGNVNQHMLRHTYATRCIESGMPAEVLQHLLGHADIKVTINTYCDVFDEFKEEHIKRSSEYLAKKGINFDFDD